MDLIQKLSDNSYFNNVDQGWGNLYYACAIGLPGESTLIDQSVMSVPYRTIIGNHNIFREYVTVHAGVEGSTRIGSYCLFMTKSHVGHDAIIGECVTVSPSAMIGGHCVIADHATIGMGAMIHQRVTVGRGAMVGMGAVVIRDVPPYTKVAGVPARVIGANEPAMKSLSDEDRNLVYASIEDMLK